MSVGRKRRTFGVRTGRPALLGAGGGGLAVTQDGSIYCPADSTEWGIITDAAAVGAVSMGWDCQDASGALAPSVGAVSLTSEGARQDYQQTVAGWTRKAVLSRGDGWLTTDASLPDLSTTSQMLLVYAKQAVSGGGENSLLWLGDFNQSAIIDASAHIKAKSAAATGSPGTEDVTGSVRPYILQVNRNTSLTTVYTDQEKVTVAIGAVTGKGLYFVGGLLTDEANVLLAAAWAGANAEMSDAEVKTLLQTLGWTIPWT